MKQRCQKLARLGGLIGVGLLLLLPNVLLAQNPRLDGRGTRLNGVVQSVNQQLNYVTVRDQRTGQSVKIDVRGTDRGGSIDIRQLRSGDVIAADGSWENRNTFRANRVNFSGNRSTPRLNDRGRMSGNGLTGVVESTNRQLNYVVVRDGATGRSVKVDVRQLDTRQSVNVWQLRQGDPIVAQGAWENNDTFRANRVDVSASRQPAGIGGSSGPFVEGVVQSVNRQLNYVTVRDRVTGRSVKIDVRRMDPRQSVNVWQLREGDSVVVGGRWEDRDTFEASTINF